MVITILAALAALVVSNVDRTRDDAEMTVALVAAHALGEALIGSPAGPGYVADLKYVPGFRSVDIRVHDLLSPSSYPAHATFDPVGNRGWRGPYLRNAAGVANIQASRAGKFPGSEDRRFAGDATFLERGFFSGSYGVAGDAAAADPWGNPFVVQVPASAPGGSSADGDRFRYARIVSAGPDGVLATPLDPLAGMLADGTAPARGDDLVLFIHRSDVCEP